MCMFVVKEKKEASRLFKKEENLQGVVSFFYFCLFFKFPPLPPKHSFVNE